MCVCVCVCVCVRIGGLVEAGELSRAAAAVVQNQSVRTEPGFLRFLRAVPSRSR